MNVRGKGRRGEREVAATWRARGYTRAAPTPGSGGMRPYGAGDLSPWPGDIWGIEPWLCEVKFDEHVTDPSGRSQTRGWDGSGFVREVLRSLQALWGRHNGIIGRREEMLPVLAARASFQAWRWFVPDWLFAEWAMPERAGFFDAESWVELREEEFFELAAYLSPPTERNLQSPARMRRR